MQRPSRPQRLDRLRHAIWPLALLAGFAACLDDDPATVDTSKTELVTNPAASEAALTTPLPAIAAGGIIDTQPNSGWTEGNFKVSPDGAATYDLPLWVPYGQGGLTPALSLHYSSQAANNILGVGWSLTGLSSVTHCPRTIAQDGYNAPPIFGGAGSGPYCLDGQRLQPQRVLSSGEIEYRTEQNSFAKIVSNNPPAPAQPDYFKVWTKDGRLLVYGNNDGGRLLAFTLRGTQPENPTLIRTSTARIIAAWGLREIYDRRGNGINILYERIESSNWAVEFVPQLITYGPDRKIRFTYTNETRPDPIESFEPGLTGSVRHRQGRRLESIAITVGGNLIRQYNFGYQEGTATGRSQLISITECDSTNVCMNALEFNWHQGSFAYTLIPTDVYDMANVNFVQSKSFYPLDINGDGRDDLIYSDLVNPAILRMRIALPFGYGPSMDVGNPVIDRFPSLQPAMRPIDFDLDGKVDLLIEVPASGGTKFALYRSTGAAYQLYSNIDSRLIGIEGGVFSAFFADIDGNGLPDYVAPSIQGNNIRWAYRLNLGSSFAPLVDTPYLSPKPSDPNDLTYQIRAVSLNGGRATQTLLPNRAGGKYDVVQLHNGIFDEGFFNLPFVKQPENRDQRNLLMADINGDGLKDAVYPLFGLSAQLNSGAGFSAIIAGPTDYAAPPSVHWTVPVRIADFDGDGADDIAIFHVGTPTDSSDYRRGLQVYSWRTDHFKRIASYPMGSSTTWAQDGIQLADWDGDGHTDILQLLAPTRPATPLRILRWNGADGQAVDRISQVNVHGLGTRVEVDYRTLADRAYYIPPADTCKYPLMCPVRVRARPRSWRTVGGSTFFYVGDRPTNGARKGRRISQLCDSHCRRREGGCATIGLALP